MKCLRRRGGWLNRVRGVNALTPGPSPGKGEGRVPATDDDPPAALGRDAADDGGLGDPFGVQTRDEAGRGRFRQRDEQSAGGLGVEEDFDLAAWRPRRRPGRRRTIPCFAPLRRGARPRRQVPARRRAAAGYRRPARYPPGWPRPSTSDGPTGRSRSRRCRRGRRTRSISSAARRLRAAIERAAAARASGPARPIWPAKARMPVPSGLVNTSRSPGRAAALVAIRRGSTSAGDGEARLDLVVLDAMAADDGHAGLGHFVQSAAEDLAEDLVGEFSRGKADDRQRGQRPPAHRINVAERIGRRDLAERVGIIDRGREDVDRLYQGRMLIEQEHARVVAGRHSHQHAGIGGRGEPGQHALQGGLVDFRAAAGAADQFGQADRSGRGRRRLAGAGADVLAAEDFAGAGVSSDRRCNGPTASSVASRGGVFPGPWQSSLRRRKKLGVRR